MVRFEDDVDVEAKDCEIEDESIEVGEQDLAVENKNVEEEVEIDVKDVSGEGEDSEESKDDNSNIGSTSPLQDARDAWRELENQEMSWTFKCNTCSFI